MTGGDKTQDDNDIEAATSRTETPPAAPTAVDIEHVHVEDDPRQWSRARKRTALIVIASGAFITGLSTSIYNPGIAEIKRDLGASDNEISLSLSIYIIISGLFPMIWSATSELYGRKPVYLCSLTIATVGCIVAALAQNAAVLIGMRCVQSIGTSAMLAVGAGTLSDIYDSHERGSKMGIYYAAPMLGPSFGPLLGGVLTQYLGWRSTFWFLAIWTGVTILGFIWPYKETFRKERSSTYQAALQKRKAAAKVSGNSRTTLSGPSELSQSEKDSPAPDMVRQESSNSTTEEELRETRLSFSDLNPFPPMLLVLKRWTNIVVLFTSGIVFGFSYSVQYTGSLVLERSYNLSALEVGLVLLAYGCGSILGAVVGGRYSDICWRQGKAKLVSEGKEEEEKPRAEVRLKTPLWSLPWLPGLVLAYGWLAEEHQALAGIIVIFFFLGLATMWTYSALTAFLVDANVGRAAMAAAANSLFRGITAFIASEVCVPIRDSIGEGGLYSIWAGIWILGGALIVLVFLKGNR